MVKKELVTPMMGMILTTLTLMVEMMVVMMEVMVVMVVGMVMMVEMMAMTTMPHYLLKGWTVEIHYDLHGDAYYHPKLLSLVRCYHTRCTV